MGAFRTDHAHRIRQAQTARVRCIRHRRPQTRRRRRPAYSGLITKNPTHDGWATHWIGSRLRSLDELAHGLGDWMPPPRWRETKKRRGDVVGLGRNCAIFESARVWAYREARRIRQRHENATPEDVRLLLDVITTEVNALNAAYAVPLCGWLSAL